MEISERFKTYLLLIAICLVLLYIIFNVGETPTFNCDVWANRFKNDFYCDIILTKKTNNGGIVVLSGRNIQTNEIVDCEDGSKWIIDNFEKFEIGDTVIKYKGKYTIIIKKKNNKILLFLKCNEKIYKD